MTTKTIVPFTNDVNTDIDLNQAVEQAQKMTTVMKKMGIVEATFATGTYFKQDDTKTTLVTEGILVQQDTNVTIVAFSNNGSSREEVAEQIAEHMNLTQTMRGALVGRSQAWISDQENDENI